jgi:hypothetical protein
VQAEVSISKPVPRQYKALAGDIAGFCMQPMVIPTIFKTKNVLKHFFLPSLKAWVSTAKGKNL